MSTKTHRVVKEPRISDNKLSDYMAASEQARRTILRSCKYQPIAAVLQHIDAHRMLAESMVDGKLDHAILSAKVDLYEGKITDTDFEEEVKKYNIDYVRNVLLIGFDEYKGDEFSRWSQAKKLDFNGTTVSFWPDLHVKRTNKRNNFKIGAINFRYSKSSRLPPKTASFQSALMFGTLKSDPFEEGAAAELDLCQTIDAYGGHVYPAPTNAIYLYNEMKAVGSAIAMQWPNIEPPQGAVL